MQKGEYLKLTTTKRKWSTRSIGAADLRFYYVLDLCCKTSGSSPWFKVDIHYSISCIGLSSDSSCYNGELAVRTSSIHAAKSDRVARGTENCIWNVRCIRSRFTVICLNAKEIGCLGTYLIDRELSTWRLAIIRRKRDLPIQKWRLFAPSSSCWAIVEAVICFVYFGLSGRRREDPLMVPSLTTRRVFPASKDFFYSDSKQLTICTVH